MAFKDYFSGHAAEYARYRPRYPDSLYEYLAAIAPSNRLAWDCATGNGQAAQNLVRFFDRVVATDGSEQQIENAVVAHGLEYRVEPAESSSLAARSADLVTVAQALHWFDLPAFEREVRRVLVDGGVLAAWSYAILEIEPAIDAVILEFYSGVLDSFWTSERRSVERGYADVDIAMQELDVPSFDMRARWDLDNVVGYLSSWSASKRYAAQHGRDPLERVQDALAEAWGDAKRERLVAWPLNLRAWRHDGSPR